MTQVQILTGVMEDIKVLLLVMDFLLALLVLTQCWGRS